MDKSIMLFASNNDIPEFVVSVWAEVVEEAVEDVVFYGSWRRSRVIYHCTT